MELMQAKKIYSSLLPHGHPNHALPEINSGNMYLITGQYENALKIQEKLL